jgi:hypothetical protein
MTRGGRVVIVHREGSRDPLVVAWQAGNTVDGFDREWLGGDYCRTVEEAGAAFSERARIYNASPTASGRALLALISADLPTAE